MLAYAASILGTICLLIVNYFMEGDLDEETALVSLYITACVVPQSKSSSHIYYSNHRCIHV